MRLFVMYEHLHIFSGDYDNTVMLYKRGIETDCEIDTFNL